MKGSKNLFKKSDPNFGSEKKNKPAFGRFKEQKLLRVAIKFFAQKILHKIPSFWDFPFMIFNKRNKKIDHEALRASQSILNLLAYITAKIKIIPEQKGCNCVKSVLLFHIHVNKVFICFHVLKLKLLFNSFKNTAVTNKTFFI